MLSKYVVHFFPGIIYHPTMFNLIFNFNAANSFKVLPHVFLHQYCCSNINEYCTDTLNNMIH